MVVEKKKVIKLKVAESHEEYVGKNIVTLSVKVKQELGIISGDVIEICGKNSTVAQVWPQKNNYKSDTTIRMDQYIRRNADVSIGDFVEIKKIDPVIANKIVLSPTKDINLISDNFDLILKKNFLGRPFISGDNVLINIFGNANMFYVESTDPKGCVLLDDSTKLVINKNAKPITKQIVGYEDIGGLKKEIESIREIIELPLKYSEYFEKLNIMCPKGILLYGPPGTGKTLLAKAISDELDAKFIQLDAPQIMAKYVGEAEERLRKVFKNAEKNAPAIIFIDEIDAIAPKRDGFVNEVEKRVVAQLLALMDGVSSRGQVVVIGATNRSNDLDMALRRPGRFDREIEIGVPDEPARLDILKIHTRNVPLSKNVDLELISKKTHGFVGADLAALVKEAGIYAIKNAIVKIENPENLKSKTTLDKLKITKKDFDHALDVVQPSALREVFVDVPQEDLSKVGALSEQKEIIKDVINLALHNKELLNQMKLTVPKNILLYGPPGTGKTMFVRACAKTYGVNFMSINGPEVLNKWVGQSEKTIRDIFKKAKDVSPCILFFDEIDSLVQHKGTEDNKTKVLDQLLTELDNLSDKDVIFVAATNRPDILDKSFVRSGRIDKIIEFKIPTDKERSEILKVLLKEIPCNKINYKEIVEQTRGFSGADLNLLIREASLKAIKDKDSKYTFNKLSQKDIIDSLDKIKPSISKDQEQFYESLRNDSQISNYIQ